MIEADDITKSFGNHTVLRGISVRVAAGEIFALLGPNGAGKTTTVRILATLSRADSGSVRIAGHDVLRDRSAVRRSIAVTGQYAALDDGQTGTENLRMMARLAHLSRRDAKARSAELLERFGLVDAAGRRVGTYSGGMRRRLDLAASLVARPTVIFLDEPTTGLDPRSRQDVWAAVAELARAGTTVLLTTQYLEEADRLADRIAVIDSGTVVAEGTADSLKRQVAGHRLEAVACDADALAELHRRAGTRTLEVDPATRLIALPVEDEAAQVRALLDELDPGADRIERFVVRTASLDDAFLALTGQSTTTKEN
jgi:ABC-2 type transport system ATP-binding protein